MNQKKLFARNLKDARKKSGLTQAKLAQLLNYSGKAVSKWETGLVFPPSEVLPLLAEILSTDLNSLFDFRQAPSYFLGVDGGGTKTKFMLTDISGQVLRELTLGPCNPTSVGIDQTVKIFIEGIKQICDDIPLGQVSAFIGSAGCGLASYQAVVTQQLSSLKLSRLEVKSDSENIISAGLKGQNGIIAIIGTGSCIFTSYDGKRHRIGGYGHLIGDAFSGTELGRACLEAVLAQLDGSGPATALTEKVIAVKGSDVSKILVEMYASDKTYIAELAPFVFESASQGDAMAQSILDRNLKHLCSQLSAAFSTLPHDKAFPLVLAGGLTHYCDQFLGKLEGMLTADNIDSIHILTDEPVVGAVLLAGAPTVKEKKPC